MYQRDTINVCSRTRFYWWWWCCLGNKFSDGLKYTIYQYLWRAQNQSGITGYCLFTASFVRLLFEGSVYFAQELRIVWLQFEGGVYFAQELQIVWLRFEGSHYSRAASIRRSTLLWFKLWLTTLRAWSLYVETMRGTIYLETKFWPMWLRKILLLLHVCMF